MKICIIDLINGFDTTGFVVIQFTIDTTGRIKDLIIRKSLISEIDNELLRVFELMPIWEPGKFWDKVIEIEMRYALKVPYKNFMPLTTKFSFGTP